MVMHNCFQLHVSKGLLSVTKKTRKKTIILFPKI